MEKKLFIHQLYKVLEISLQYNFQTDVNSVSSNKSLLYAEH